MSQHTQVTASIGKPDGEATKRNTDSESGERGTPADIIERLKSALGGPFDLDPASGAQDDDLVIAHKTYDKEEDGLLHPWFGRVWLNPDYSDMDIWMKKAVEEYKKPRTEFILVLIPSYGLSADWFQDYANNATLMVPIDGRLKFTNTSGTAYFASLILAFGQVSESVHTAFRDLGTVYRVEADSKTDPTQQAYFFEVGSSTIDTSESNTVASMATDTAELAHASKGDIFRLSFDYNTPGTPDIGRPEPMVIVETTRIHNDHIEHLMYDPETEVWYVIRVAAPDGNSEAVGGGHESTESYISAAVEIPKQGWHPITLRKITRPYEWNE